MRKSFKFAFALAPLSLAAMLLAACSGDGSSPVIEHPAPDAAVIFPDAANCDPVVQNCVGDGTKCSLDLTQNDTTMVSTWGATCRAQTGTLAIGAHCMRNGEGALGVGKDDCLKANYCTAIGDTAGNTTDTARVCRAFCNSSSSCSKGEGCFALTKGLLPAEVGFCIGACTILGAGCTGGAWCRPGLNMEGTSLGFCAAPGTVAVGGTCDATKLCAANSTCVTPPGATTSLCASLCDVVPTGADAGVPLHPCTAPAVCKPVNGFPTDWGVCS